MMQDRTSAHTVTNAHVAAAPINEYVAPVSAVAYAAPVTTMTATPTAFPTAPFPIATALVVGFFHQGVRKMNPESAERQSCFASVSSCSGGAVAC